MTLMLSCTSFGFLWKPKAAGIIHFVGFCFIDSGGNSLSDMVLEEVSRYGVSSLEQCKKHRNCIFMCFFVFRLTFTCLPKRIKRFRCFTKIAPR